MHQNDLRVQVDGPASGETGGVLTIDIRAIVHNWRELKARSAPAACSAVVKADAYGCGIEPVVAGLLEAGCETFFVAHLFEARRVRAVAPGAIIYVLNGLIPGTPSAYAEGNFRPVIGSFPELEEWEAFVTNHNWLGGAAIHIDTGMNRLGFALTDVPVLAARVTSRRGFATLVMSHFVSAEIPERASNAKQMGMFTELRRQFGSIPGSLANSSGIFLGPDALYDMVRPGVGLFGANPTPGHLNPMRPVVHLQGHVVQVRTIETGETVGYNALWTARRPSRIAVVSVGYADGYVRAAGSSDVKAGGNVVVAGRNCPLAGRVSMDLLAVDVTDLPSPPQRGDLVTLLGDGFGVDDLAAHAGTIGYEVLTSLGWRYRRVYRGV